MLPAKPVKNIPEVTLLISYSLNTKKEPNFLCVPFSGSEPISRERPSIIGYMIPLTRALLLGIPIAKTVSTNDKA